jgi:hypothetical protein
MKLTLHFFLTIVIALLLANTLNATTYTATTTGVWSASGTWDANGVPDGSGTGDVVINNAVVVTIDVASTITINNLTISGTLQTSKTLSNAIVVNGDILVNSGASFKVQTNTTGGTGLGHTLDLKGNLTHNGSTLDLRAGTAGSTLSVLNLTLSGTADQTLTVSTTYSSANGDFNAVTINKPSGKVILGSNIVMSGGSSTGPVILNSTLTFISGIIETGSYIWISQSTTEAQVTGYSSSSYIVGAMGRGMSSSAGGNKYFPVGDANGFRLFYLRSTTSGSATGHYAIVKCISGDANTGSSTFSGPIDRVSQIRYYQIGYSNNIAGASNMSFDLFKVSYGADDGVIAGNQNLRVAYSTNSRATWTMISQNNPHTTVIAVSDPQTMITPDALVTPIQLAGSGGLGNLYVSLADSTNAENPLPVELASFTSNVNGRDITLNWETKTEKNSDKFIVERTIINDNSKWEAVATVKAAVLSNSPKQYSFTDKNLQAAKYQYRLKMIDNDGSFNYSVIVETEVALPKTFDLSQNYPNPFNPSTKINYNLASDSKVTLEVYSISGERVVLMVDQNQPAGFYSVNFTNKNISSGVYFYRITAIDKITGNQFSSIKKMMFLK